MEANHFSLSKPEWCRQNDINIKTFFYWQRKICFMEAEKVLLPSELPAISVEQKVAASPIFVDITQLYMKTGKTDLRRGVDGLKAIVQLKYGLEPLEPGMLYLFCGTQRDRITGLVFEGDGYLLLTKRLSDGTYHLPRDTDEALVLDRDVFLRLMDGESSIQIPAV